MDANLHGRAVEELDPQQLLRAISHGLANRLLAIRCRAEPAAAASSRGRSVEDELAELVAETGETMALVRELAAAAHEMLAPAELSTAELASVILRRFPAEVDFEEELLSKAS